MARGGTRAQGWSLWPVGGANTHRGVARAQWVWPNPGVGPVSSGRSQHSEHSGRGFETSGWSQCAEGAWSEPSGWGQFSDHTGLGLYPVGGVNTQRGVVRAQWVEPKPEVGPDPVLGANIQSTVQWSCGQEVWLLPGGGVSIHNRWVVPREESPASWKQNLAEHHFTLSEPGVPDRGWSRRH